MKCSVLGILAASHAAAAIKVTDSGPDNKACHGEKSLMRGIDAIKQMTPERGMEQKHWAELIRRTGLTPDKRNPYGNESASMLPLTEDVEKLIASGWPAAPVGLWQIPNQLGCAMAALKDMQINSYFDIGTWSGWTSSFIVSGLKRYAELDGRSFDSRIFTTDIKDWRDSCVAKIHESIGVRQFIWPEKVGHDWTFSVTNVTKLQDQLPKKIDLCFIDGDHRYDGLRRDICQFKDRCKYLMFHDIVDSKVSVSVLWERAKRGWKENPVWECKQQPEGIATSGADQQRIMGIGIMRMDHLQSSDGWEKDLRCSSSQ